MGLRELIRGLAAGAPVPVFAVAGAGARESVQDLRLRPELRLVDTPRAASVLLVAGAVPDSLAEPLARVHDALAHPRATVWWDHGATTDRTVAAFPNAVRAGANPVEAIVRVHRELLGGRRESEPPLLPDVDPAPWRGVGPYGQGGTGMTGGVPYGRPMASLAPDRDGLRLDAIPIKVGPFFPRFPTGLTLAVTLAGDVVTEAAVEGNPFEALRSGGSARPGLEPFLRALAEPVPVRDLELARARSHLRWLADALMAQGLPSLASRVLRMAHKVGPGGGAALCDLAKALGWTQVLRWSVGTAGRLAPEDAKAVGGPVARAAGFADDARLEDPAYRDLGFEPVLLQGGDVAARWQQRLAEAAQSLDLAARAGDRRSTPGEWVEAPRGRFGAAGSSADRLLPLLPALLRGLEWGDAVATLISLDLDLEEAGFVRPRVREGVAA